MRSEGIMGTFGVNLKSIKKINTKTQRHICSCHNNIYPSSAVRASPLILSELQLKLQLLSNKTFVFAHQSTMRN